MTKFLLISDGDAEESSSGGEGSSPPQHLRMFGHGPSVGPASLAQQPSSHSAPPPPPHARDLAPHLGLPPSVIVTAHPPPPPQAGPSGQQLAAGTSAATQGQQQPAFRTLAARKAYDEPLELSIRRKETEMLHLHRWVTPTYTANTGLSFEHFSVKKGFVDCSEY